MRHGFSEGKREQTGRAGGSSSSEARRQACCAPSLALPVVAFGSRTRPERWSRSCAFRRSSRKARHRATLDRGSE